MKFRTLQTAAVSLIALSMIPGCSAVDSGGQSQSEALAQVQAVDGIESAVIDSGGSYNGFKRESDTLVSVRLSPGFKIARTSDLAEFLVRVAWSVNTEEPNTDLAFRLKGSPDSDFEAAFRDAGWDFPSHPGGTYVYIPPEVVRAKLGRWPGPVPKLPEGMIVAETDAGA